ncbi:MAG: hypothetical protein NTV82_02515 [Candidatus Aminicenantes bacterium]|nr:hypothetical protein [Candidatus Aminicenantes bacterium]
MSVHFLWAGLTALTLVPAGPWAKPSPAPDVQPLRETLRIDLSRDFDGSPVASASDYAVAEDGSIYVLDSKGARVLRFDSAGRFLGAFGRPGQGPGDLQRPLWLVLIPAGEIVVADGYFGYFSVFSREGKYLRRRAERSAHMVDGLFSADSDRFILSTTRYGPSAKGVTMERVIELTDAAFQPIRTLYRVREDSGGKNPGRVYFTYAPGPQGELYILNRSSREYRISVLDPAGKPRADITRPFHPVAKCPKDLAEEKRLWTSRMGQVAAREGGSSGEARVNPDKFAVREIAVDEAGRLWATTVGPEPCDRDVYVDLFSPEGNWLKRFRLGRFASPQIKVMHGSLYALDGEGDDRPAFVRYAIESGGGKRS